jgi:hypothetical protein
VLLQQHPPRGWAGVGRGAPPAPATSRKQATSHQQPAGARRPAKRAAGQAPSAGNNHPLRRYPLSAMGGGE